MFSSIIALSLHAWTRQKRLNSFSWPSWRQTQSLQINFKFKPQAIAIGPFILPKSKLHRQDAKEIRNSSFGLRAKSISTAESQSMQRKTIPSVPSGSSASGFCRRTFCQRHHSCTFEQFKVIEQVFDLHRAVSRSQYIMDVRYIAFAIHKVQSFIGNCSIE